jgi:hypothetical protein
MVVLDASLEGLPARIVISRWDPDAEDVINKPFVIHDGLREGVAAFVFMGGEEHGGPGWGGWAPMVAPSSWCQVASSNVKLLLHITIERASNSSAF